MTSFEKAFQYTLGNEGKYSNDKNDSGGETCWGITISEARRHGYMGDMKLLPIELAKQIYRSDYWDFNKSDAIALKNENIAIEIFDTAVNCGAMTSAKMFQEALNFLNCNQKYWSDIVVDGAIGPKTMAIYNDLNSTSLKYLYNILNIEQGARYLEICRKKLTQEDFIRGWCNRVDLIKVYS